MFNVEHWTRLNIEMFSLCLAGRIVNVLIPGEQNNLFKCMHMQTYMYFGLLPRAYAQM